MITFLLFQAAIGIFEYLTPLLMIVAPIITQGIKKFWELNSKGAVLATVGVSIGLAIFGAWATGTLVLGAATVTTATAIFTAATLIYKLLMATPQGQTVLAKANLAN